VGAFNGHDVMVVKAKGGFVWHSHPDTDDFFLVLKGRLTIHLRDGEVRLGPGELCVVPRGVEHRPVAEEEVHLLLIEPAGTPNTGDREPRPRRWPCRRLPEAVPRRPGRAAVRHPGTVGPERGCAAPRRSSARGAVRSDRALL
jgi:mannose-6-phosphate isomerase-like protein (cupin superfamily)